MNNNEYEIIYDKNKNDNSQSNILLLLLFLVIGALGMYAIMKALPGTTVVNKLEKEVTINEKGISDAVEKVYDSVVVVENYKNNKLYSTGTGFIYKKDNNKYYIITNYHVIEGSTDVKVIFTDNNTVTVKNLGGDKYADIAVLEFDTDKEYAIAQIGSSIDAKLGDTLFTVGAPLVSSTYSWSVTRGILSGKDRMVPVSMATSSSNDYIMKVLQTDAAINSGNSGGPLCNSNGQVIGVTNMKLAASGVEGMGFAIPIEDAVSFATKIVLGEDITRPKLGVSMIELTTAQTIYNIEIPKNVEDGVMIYEIEPNSTADTAGLQSKDIILEFDNIKINSSPKLKYELYRHNVGDEVTIKINRNGAEKTITITLKK